MPDVHCVLDTSALLKRYTEEDGTEIIDALFDQADCARHIVNVTVAEVLGAFFRWKLRGKLNAQRLKDLRRLFKQDRDTHKLIIHSIHSGNMSFINSVYDHSFSVPAPVYVDREGTKKEKSRIGPVDVLILTVCKELRECYKVCLFSSDEHMLTVARDKLGVKVYNPEQIDRLPF